MTEQFSNKGEAWSARFSEPVSDLVKRYTASVFFDKRLAMFDIEGSLAHAEGMPRPSIVGTQFEADAPMAHRTASSRRMNRFMKSSRTAPAPGVRPLRLQRQRPD